MTKLANLTSIEVIEKFNPLYSEFEKALDDIMECTAGSEKFVSMSSLQRCNSFNLYRQIRGFIESCKLDDSDTSVANFASFKFTVGGNDVVVKFLDEGNNNFRAVCDSQEAVVYEKMSDRVTDMKTFFRHMYRV